MTIGQLSFYDQVKKMLLESGHFQDNLFLHFTASSIAGGIATCMTQPLDVLKTRAMNAKPGEFSGIFDIVRSVAKLGPLGKNQQVFLSSHESFINSSLFF
jgi:dicarboxylate transporter 10